MSELRCRVTSAITNSSADGWRPNVGGGVTAGVEPMARASFDALDGS